MPDIGRVKFKIEDLGLADPVAEFPAYLERSGMPVTLVKVDRERYSQGRISGDAYAVVEGAYLPNLPGTLWQFESFEETRAFLERAHGGTNP